MGDEGLLAQLAQYHLTPKTSWLGLAKDFCTLQGVQPSRETIFEQFLFSDLKESYQSPQKIPTNASKFVITKPVIFQVLSVLNIAQPVYDQYRDLTASHDSLSWFHGDGEEDESECIPVKNGASSTGRRMLKISLTDGVSNVNGIEYGVLTCIDENTVPGTKVLLTSRVLSRNGMLLLNDANCQVLGGDVESLCKQFSRVQFLAKIIGLDKKLKKPEPPPVESFKAPKPRTQAPVEDSFDTTFNTTLNTSGTLSPFVIRKPRALNSAVNQTQTKTVENAELSFVEPPNPSRPTAATKSVVDHVINKEPVAEPAVVEGRSQLSVVKENESLFKPITQRVEPRIAVGSQKPSIVRKPAPVTSAPKARKKTTAVVSALGELRGVAPQRVSRSIADYFAISRQRRPEKKKQAKDLPRIDESHDGDIEMLDTTAERSGNFDWTIIHHDEKSSSHQPELLPLPPSKVAIQPRPTPPQPAMAPVPARQTAALSAVKPTLRVPSTAHENLLQKKEKAGPTVSFVSPHLNEEEPISRKRERPSLKPGISQKASDTRMSMSSRDRNVEKNNNIATERRPTAPVVRRDETMLAPKALQMNHPERTRRAEPPSEPTQPFWEDSTAKELDFSDVFSSRPAMESQASVWDYLEGTTSCQPAVDDQPFFPSSSADVVTWSTASVTSAPLPSSFITPPTPALGPIALATRKSVGGVSPIVPSIEKTRREARTASSLRTKEVFGMESFPAFSEGTLSTFGGSVGRREKDVCNLLPLEIPPSHFGSSDFGSQEESGGRNPLENVPAGDDVVSRLYSKLARYDMMTLAEALSKRVFWMMPKVKCIQGICGVPSGLTAEDERWVLTVNVSDVSCKDVACQVDSLLLEKMLGFSPRSVQGVLRKRSSAELNQYKSRAKSVSNVMKRLDLLLFIQFAPERNCVPQIVAIRSFTEIMQSIQ